MEKLKIAFICVHNSCRSQISECLGHLIGNEYFESYSAGTKLKNQINQDAVRIVKDIYNINMENNQKPKLLNDIPKVDIVITMGCNVECPNLTAKYYEDWGLEDPTGKSDEEFKKIIFEIEKNINLLIEKIKNKYYIV